MAITNAQYDEIMRGYQKRQLRNRHLTESKIQALYKKAPHLKELNDAIATASVALARQRLSDNKAASGEWKKKLEDYRKERAALLENIGYSEELLEPVYTCYDCKDTGYIGNEKCHCFRQKAIRFLYSSSRLETMLEQLPAA